MTALKWEDIDLSSATLKVVAGKGGKTARVNLSSTLVEALEQVALDKRTGYLLPAWSRIAVYKRLGEGLANLATLFDPNLIIIGGEGVAVSEALLEPMKRAFERRKFIKTAPVELVISTWGDDAWARGAAGLVVEHFFEGFTPSLDERSGVIQKPS